MNLYVRFLVLTAVVVCPAAPRATSTEVTLRPVTLPAGGPADLLPNGGLEDGVGTSETAPDGWTREGYALPAADLTWETAAGRGGSRSFMISTAVFNDVRWVRTLALSPNRNYLLSGWIKTRTVASQGYEGDGGALLSVGNTSHTTGLNGTNDWTEVKVVFNSGATGSVRIMARLGMVGGREFGYSAGTAWFDDLQVKEIRASDPHPGWKILVLIYERTDFTYSDASGTHHLVGEIGSAQMATAAANATRFINTDIPTLTNRHMIPQLTIRYPGTLDRLSPHGSGFWPSPAETAAHRDPAFDSVFVIWQPTVVDQGTRQTRWVGSAAGLAMPTSGQQTYLAIIIEAATQYGHLNVFKHEFGHSILFHFQATGTAPSPAVDNHAVANQYVNCKTGQHYDWRDEVDTANIPNSIYNNSSGFTHDYYSGLTALASDPTRCLGITAEAWAAGGPVSQPSTSPPPLSLDRGALQFSALRAGTAFGLQTSAQLVRLLQLGTESVSWTATTTQSWLTVSPASGTGSAQLKVGVRYAPDLPASGLTAGAVELVYRTAGGSAPGGMSVAVALSVSNAAASSPPIGVVDTPGNDVTGVTGSLAVTGWAVDDVEVRRVRLMRDPVSGEGPNPVFIGDAVMVEGARVDVATLYASFPRNTQAGWGYLLLTNTLPNQGDGIFRLHAYADDADGHSTLLGSRSITCTNSAATRPFGAIDTPAQGETVSGASYNNFGWVLSRGPALAYPPNGTVSVVVDGVIGATPGGWTNRSDLTALFPASTYPGITNALGVSTLDTTGLANGVHTISWVVTASDGQADGIGSRYFAVANGTSRPAVMAGLHAGIDAIRSERITAPPSQPGRRDDINAAPLDHTPIAGRRGYDVTTPLQSYAAGATGRFRIQGEELDRIELLLGQPGVYTGYVRAADEFGPLPVGSHLDKDTGHFTWSPGVGFVRGYDLVFMRCGSTSESCRRREVRVVLHPKGSNRVGPQVTIDTPSAQSAARPLVLAGWAVDLDADIGTGIDAVHVWAYPLAGADPQFVGAAVYGGVRPDVGAVFGERFTGSGYGLLVEGLSPGTYDLAVFGWSTVLGRFAPAKLVRVTVR